MKWHFNGLVGKNRIIGQVHAQNRSEAILRGFRAVHTKYPHSLVILFEDSFNEKA